MERTDEQLVLAIAAHDAGALEALYSRYGRLAFSLAVRIVAVPETAEEIVQEAFLSIWRGAATYQPGRAAVRTWLLSITHHRAVDAVRRRAKRVATAPLDEQAPYVGPQDVWTAVRRTLEGAEVRAALARLPAAQRQSIELAYFGGLAHQEIATRLGLPTGTVKSRLRLGLHKLHTLLENPYLRAVEADEGAGAAPARTGGRSGAVAATRRRVERTAERTYVRRPAAIPRGPAAPRPLAASQ